jgi:nitroimidazol reductase NimA-like FMN-containing flavoprotein (pyridoxamine 5'-phosphate oxidase superfamily)
METRTNTQFNAEVDTYLRSNHAVTLSTSSFTGLPHANTAPYVSDDERLYFFVRDESILLSNLVDSHRAAFTVDEYAPPWQKRRELHGFGTCGCADERQASAALERCAQKFGDFRPTGAIWWLEPAGMYFIDYTF